MNGDGEPVRRIQAAATVLVVVGVLLGGYAAVDGGPFGGGAVNSGTAADTGDPLPRFREVAVERGLDYETTGPNVGNGRGAALVADYDNDGRPDLLAVGGDRPRLFENTGGAFDPATALPGGLGTATYKGGLFFDYDNDGWQDLLLLPHGGEAVFLENDAGRFERRDVGLSVNLTWGTSAAAADYNRDGCVDVFVAQNGDWRDTIPRRAQGESLSPDNGNPNYLFRGNCSGFERVEDAGIGGTKWSLATSFVDFDGDGLPDVHVANDFNYDVLYVNRGDGSFERRRLNGTNRHAMASEVADVNADGRPDLFVTNIEYPHPERVWLLQNGLEMKNRGNNLLINRGNGTFDDRATAYGVRQGGWGWSGNLVDLDNDGDLDLLHTTQDYNYRAPTAGGTGGGSWRPQSDPPALWTRRDDRNGTFERVNATRAGFEDSNGRGLATLDYDGDGDRDVVVADASGRFKLYENRNAAGNWLRVRVAPPRNGTALGAEAFLTTANGTQHRLRNSRTNYFSQNARTLHFGLGVERVGTLRVVWPDGTERRFDDVPVNRTVVVSPDGGLSVEGRAGNRTATERR